MSRAKIAITLQEETLHRLDHLVESSVFPSRSRAVRVAVDEKLERLEGSRLARECAKLEPEVEQAMQLTGHHAPARWERPLKAK